VILIGVDGYESGTTFADGQRFCYTVPKPTEPIEADACNFLDSSGPEPVWSPRGCETDIGQFTVSCCCDHATSFAVLVAGDSSSRGGGASDDESLAISVISYVGVCISMTCFVVMLAVYGYFKQARRERSKKVFLNIVVMLLLMMLLYLLGALVGPDSLGTGGCKLVAVLLQYSVLAAFSWMLAEGHLLLSGLSNPFLANGAKTIWGYGTLAYGGSAVYVAIFAGVFWNEYGEQPSGVCYVSNRILPTVYVPIGVVGLVNMYVFHKVWRALAAVPKSLRRTALQNWRQRMQVDAFKAVSLFAVLGSTWLVGLLFLTGDTVVWEYPFILLNAFQGLWIFMTHCLYDRELRAEIAEYNTTRRKSKSHRSRPRSSSGPAVRRSAPWGQKSMSILSNSSGSGADLRSGCQAAATTRGAEEQYGLDEQSILATNSEPSSSDRAAGEGASELESEIENPFFRADACHQDRRQGDSAA